MSIRSFVGAGFRPRLFKKDRVLVLHFFYFLMWHDFQFHWLLRVFNLADKFLLEVAAYFAFDYTHAELAYLCVFNQLYYFLVSGFLVCLFVLFWIFSSPISMFGDSLRVPQCSLGLIQICHFLMTVFGKLNHLHLSVFILVMDFYPGRLFERISFFVFGRLNVPFIFFFDNAIVVIKCYSCGFDQVPLFILVQVSGWLNIRWVFLYLTCFTEWGRW